MKRHISIFAFLLGAFAVSLDAQANIAMKGYGIYTPGSDELTLEDSDHKYFSPQTATITYNMVPYTVELVSIDSGWAVDHWLVCEDKNPNDYSTWKKIEGSEGRTQYVFADKDAASGASVATLAVKFRWIKYNVSYDTAGGSPEQQSKTYGYDESFELPAPPQWTGRTFTGWRSSPRDGTFDAGATVSGSSLCPDAWHEDGSNVTMTAQWTVNTNNISFVLGGGKWPEGGEPADKLDYDRVLEVPSPHRTGYVFAGWDVSGADAETVRWGTTTNPDNRFDADEPFVPAENPERPLYFLNFNPTNAAAVSLSARWENATITVTLNNHGAPEGHESVDVVYGESYKAMNPPQKEGSVFGGYEIGGALYWDSECQPTKPAWDIPTNCTADAKWTDVDYHLTYNENRSDGVVSKEHVQTFRRGESVVLYDGAEFSNPGCTLLGWSVDANATRPDDGCEKGARKVFIESKKLYAVWEPNYFIAYDGNGATNETPMGVQTLVIGKQGQSLTPNAYGKVGYSFLGWATNRIAAQRLDWQYRDRQVLLKDLAETVGETNTLYATWGTNTYAIAFDPNGGSGTPMEPLKNCPYDTAVVLRDCSYRNGAYDFAGWSNDVAKVIYADLEVPVSNLCATANGTNTLYAVWKLSDLSAAMGCDNLRWFSPSSKDASWTTPSGKWSPGALDIKGVIVSCVTNCGSSFDTLQSDALTKGMLRFSWHSTGGSMAVLVYGGTPNSHGNMIQPLVTTDEDGLAKIAIDPAEIPGGPYDSAFVVIMHSKDGTCSIHDMTWTPEGGEPKYADEDTEVTDFSMADGKLSFSFDSDGSSTYHILGTNDVTAPWPWPFVREIEADETQPVQIDIKADEPKMFYRIRALIP